MRPPNIKMPSISFTVLTSALAILTSVVGLVVALSERRKNIAEAKAKEAEVANKDVERQKLEAEITTSVLSQCKAQMDNLGKQLDDVKRENKALRTWARQLVAQLETAGIEPAKYEEA